MRARLNTQWTKIKWPFDDKFAAELDKDGIDVYELRVGEGRIILRDDKFKKYVASFGNDSECSFSGCFYPQTLTLCEAQEKLKERDWS